jgi:phage baseplate assembly protein W
MAYRIANKFPIDTKAGRAIGVSIPFSAPWVFTSTFQTKDAIRTNLINFFLTNRNERVFQPTFGGNLRRFIFESISRGTTESIKQNIQEGVTRYFPQVLIRDIEILSSEDLNTLNVILSYEIVNFGINDELNLTFEQ